MKKAINKKVGLKKPTSFRLQVFSRHPSHNALREANIRLPFRALVRFGSTTVPDKKYDVEINSPEAVRISSNKLLMKRKFKQAGIPTAEWWEGTQDTINLLLKPNKEIQEKFPIVAKSLHGSRGRGNYLLKTQDDLKAWITGKNLNNYIFEKFYSYNREYRLHVTEDGCFYTCRKMLKSDTPNEKRWFRNDSNSVWILEENPDFDKPVNWDKIIAACIAGLKAVGLDVAAFDVRVQSAKTGKGEVRPEPQFIILESNSAPSMGQITEVRYIEQLPLIAKKKVSAMTTPKIEEKEIEQKEQAPVVDRQALVIKPVERNNTYSLNYRVITEKGVPRAFSSEACFSNFRRLYLKKESYGFVGYENFLNMELHVPNKSNYPLESIKKWVEFMCLCGYPCTLTDPTDNEFMATIHIKMEDYLNKTHFWIAITAIRYIIYTWSSSYHTIPQIATELYANLPELDAHQAFLFAHWHLSGYDSSHGVPYEKPFKLLTKEELFERIKQTGDTLASINETTTEFFKNVVPHNVYTLIREKKPQQALDLIKKLE